MDEKLWLETMLLKNLKSMDMRMGEKTHHILSDYLRLLKLNNPAKDGAGSEEGTIQALKDEMTEIMTKEFQQSKARNYAAGYDRDNKF